MKIFDYALAGRAMLSVRLSGVDRVLGQDAFYFDHNAFERSLAESFQKVAQIPKAELKERGLNLQNKLMEEYRWDVVAKGLSEFYLKHIRE